MNKGLLAFAAALLIGALAVWGVYSSNVRTLVDADEGVVKAMGDIQSNVKRRADLIPNLVATVEAAGNLEKSTLEAVMKARAEATKSVINIDPTTLVNDPAKLKAAQDAMNSLSGTLSRLLVSTEAYPTLKANENFLSLQKQLEGTENRINYARENYNKAVFDNNKKVRDPWTGMFANAAGAKVRASFEATAEEQKTPKVEFGKARS